MHRARQIGEKAPRAGERLLLGIDGVVHRAASRLDLPAAEFLFAQVLTDPGHDRRSGNKHRRGFRHHRIMTRRQPRRAETGDRTEPERDDRHYGHVRGHVVEAHRLADPARQIGAPLGFDRLDRSAAAGAFDDAHDRQAEFGGHALGHQRLFVDRSVSRSAAHGEVVADHDDRSAVDPSAPEYAVRGGEGFQLVVLVVGRTAGNRPGLVEAFGIDQPDDPLAHGQPAAIVLTLDFVRPAHLMRQPLAQAKLVEFSTPGHRHSLLVSRCRDFHTGNAKTRALDGAIASIILTFSSGTLADGRNTSSSSRP